MRNVIFLAINVIRDSFRKKIFYVVFIFGLAMLALSPLLPSFELGLQAQFLRDVSISLTSLFGAVLAVIVAVGQLPVEIEKKTIYNILSKPVSRLQYFAGKFLGVVSTLAIILLVMGIEIIILIYLRLKVFSPIVFEGVLMVFLESCIIASFCYLMTTFASIPVGVLAAIFFYVLCHVKTGYLHGKLIEGVSGAWRVLTWSLYYIIPNLENYNISQQVGYGHGVPGGYTVRVLLYALLFVGLFIFIGYAVFRRKDL